MNSSLGASLSLFLCLPECYVYHFLNHFSIFRIPLTRTVGLPVMAPWGGACTYTLVLGALSLFATEAVATLLALAGAARASLQN